MSNLVRFGAAFTRRLAIVLAAAALVAAAVGCGGGGGGGGGGGTGGTGGSGVTVTGTVLQAETGQPPSPGATVAIGGVSATTGSDGSFSLSNVGSKATSVTVTSSGAQTLTQAVSLATPVSGVVNIGTLYTSNTGYTATVTGKIVQLSATQPPVSGAVVTIAGLSATTAADGTFTINNLPVGLGSVSGEAVGQITDAKYVTTPLTSDNLQFALGAGANNIGTIPIPLLQSGSTTTPPPPYTITGFVTVAGAVPSSPVTVGLELSGAVVNTTTTNSAGQYYFWVIPGAYTVTANVNGTSQSQAITLKYTNVPVTVTTMKF